MTEEPGHRPLNVLFLCTHNSARSVMAECIMNRVGGGRFKAYSAGSTPSGVLDPRAISLLRRLNYKTDHLRSKAWDEFAILTIPTRRTSISSSPSATTQQARSVLSGQVNR